MTSPRPHANQWKIRARSESPDAHLSTFSRTSAFKGLLSCSHHPGSQGEHRAGDQCATDPESDLSWSRHCHCSVRNLPLLSLLSPWWSQITLVERGLLWWFFLFFMWALSLPLHPIPVSIIRIYDLRTRNMGSLLLTPLLPAPLAPMHKGSNGLIRETGHASRGDNTFHMNWTCMGDRIYPTQVVATEAYCPC